MGPIRVGIIGLSKRGWARTAHLPYLNNTDKFQIVALCNNSAESARESIRLHGLPSTTRAYGNPEDLAKDEDVDLVVCSVRVDYHLATIGPSLKAGKNVFVEWPLGKNLADAKELLRLKEEGNVKVAVVGLQGRQGPILKKLRVVIESGRIGKVLSSNWTGYANNLGPTTSEALEYLGHREVGGNILSIHLGHSVDYVQNVLGYGFQTPPKSLLANRRKTVNVIDAEGKVLRENQPKTSDDTIFVHGTLSTGIPISLTLRGGKPFKGTPAVDWRIYGEKGEIRVSASGIFIPTGYPDLKIEVHDFEKDTVEKVDVETDEFDDEDIYALPARNVGRVYRAIANGEINCSFEDAVERHALLEGFYHENGIDLSAKL